MVVSRSLLRKIELQEDFLEFLKNEQHNHFWIRFSSELTFENVFRNVVPHGGRQSIDCC